MIAPPPLAWNSVSASVLKTNEINSRDPLFHCELNDPKYTNEINSRDPLFYCELNDPKYPYLFPLNAAPARSLLMSAAWSRYCDLTFRIPAK